MNTVWLAVSNPVWQQDIAHALLAVGLHPRILPVTLPPKPDEEIGCAISGIVLADTTCAAAAAYRLLRLPDAAANAVEALPLLRRQVLLVAESHTHPCLKACLAHAHPHVVHDTLL